jgi:glutamine amidotransferase
LRNQPTLAETILWGHLCKGNQFGIKFRRQHPISYYIADFYCHVAKLVIEIDGSIHNVAQVLQNDIERQVYLESLGLKVIRFTNEDILNNLETVLEKIDQSTKSSEKIAIQSSSPFRGRGGLGIVYYGAGNIFSLTSALDRLGIGYGMIHAEADFEHYDRYIIPGVGHAGAAMSKLESTGLVPIIKQLNKPTLGICVGMQLLTSYSEEGDSNLLNIIPVKTLRFKDGAEFKVPHTGWNQVYPDTENPLFKNIPQGAHFYFVHSYYIEHNEAYTLASTNYTLPFSASIHKDNFFGVQFHPEKSGAFGEQLLTNFANI